MNLIIGYQWEIFIIIEVLSIVALLLFGVVRYFLGRKKRSLLFIFLFLGLIALEALLAVFIFLETGEISNFQIIITIFVVYACTFGIFDFKKLDRWMRLKIGKLRGVELLKEKDYQIMERNKNPNYLAKKYRRTSLAHLTVFVIVQAFFWMKGTDSFSEMFGYLRDLSWIEAGTAEKSPYPNETIYSIGMLWGLIFIIDFIWSWSYTFFPSKPNK